MSINTSPHSRISSNSIDKYRTDKFKEYGMRDQESSQRPYVIIENNLEVIQQLENLIQQILEFSENGLESESVDKKNKALQNIYDKITQLNVKD